MIVCFRHYTDYSLMKVKQLELLQKLFDIVYILDAVYQETNAKYGSSWR